MKFRTSMLLLPLSLLFGSFQQTLAAPSDFTIPSFGSKEPHLPAYSLDTRALPTGTCDANTPCVNAACCGTNGLCGYSPTECGSGNCTSNCDAKAQCGQYGKAGSQNCPLGVCCSEFGFCGSTSDFCDKGCQAGFGGCGPVKRPSCGGSSITKRTIGYYEAWANTRKCSTVSPEDLNLNGFTHINFAFAFFDPATYAIAPMDSPSGELFSRFTALKAKQNGLQTWISVGGWSFTDPGPTRSAFSDMTSSSGNRGKFIQGLVEFMDHYGFDGVDLDWEYPQADDRGGLTADKDNYVALVKDMRAVLGTKYGISMTLPTSYWYLQHFDLAKIQPNVDFFNFMTYDLHGVWDAQSQFLGPYIAPHTNMTEIDMGLDLLWRAGVTPDKVNLGLGWYGRSFTLTDPSCNTPNGVCKFSRGADAGPCTDASGILDLQEIEDIISAKGLIPVWDKTAAVKWITWNSNQWISYDDDDTFQQKRDFANSRCLGGTMVWAIDQRDQTEDNGLAAAPGITTQNQQDAKQLSDNLAAGLTCYTTDCNQKCKSGSNQVSQMNGQPNQLSTNDRCKAGEYRNLCCSDGTKMGTCQWRGYRGVGLSCMGGCADGETEVVKDTNSFEKSTGSRTCTGGTQSYCCKGFRPAPSGSDVLGQAKDAAKAAAEAAAEQAALDIAARAFCRIAVPALLAPLELLEDLIPIVGEILDIAEVAATPALINLCTKDIEKSGKAEFKVFGKKHTLSMDKPRATKESRPPESSHTRAKTSSCGNGGKRAENGDYCDPQFNKRVTTRIIDDFEPVIHPILCNAFGQACYNYRSVGNLNAGYAILTCPFRRKAVTGRPVSSVWNRLHKTALWDPKITALPPSGCSPDEYPPAVMADVNDGYNDLTATTDLPPRNFQDRGQRIRYLPADVNEAAGRGLFNVCPGLGPHRTEDGELVSTEHRRRADTTWTKVRAVFTRSRFSMDFAGLDHPADDGIPDNPCAPTFEDNGVVAKHPGFALVNTDQWFDTHAAERALIPMYARAPPNKRSWIQGRGLVVVDGNSSRAATPSELRRELGFESCGDDACSRELVALREVTDAVRDAVIPTGPVRVVAEATMVSRAGIVQAGLMERLPGSGPLEPGIPRQTGSVSSIRTKEDV